MVATALHRCGLAPMPSGMRRVCSLALGISRAGDDMRNVRHVSKSGRYVDVVSNYSGGTGVGHSPVPRSGDEIRSRGRDRISIPPTGSKQWRKCQNGEIRKTVPHAGLSAVCALKWGDLNSYCRYRNSISTIPSHHLAKNGRPLRIGSQLHTHTLSGTAHTFRPHRRMVCA